MGLVLFCTRVNAVCLHNARTYMYSFLDLCGVGLGVRYESKMMNWVLHFVYFILYTCVCVYIYMYNGITVLTLYTLGRDVMCTVLPLLTLFQALNRLFPFLDMWRGSNILWRCFWVYVWMSVKCVMLLLGCEVIHKYMHTSEPVRDI